MGGEMSNDEIEALEKNISPDEVEQFKKRP